MYSSFQLAAKFLRYFLVAANGKGHGIHSPFVYHFITQILNDHHDYPAYSIVEDYRAKLRKDETMLSVEDLGAGSSLASTQDRTVASIARHAAKSRKFGQLLFRMVQQWKPAHILELGTSLGITTSYLSLANPSGSIITMEGATQVGAVAKRHFEQSGLHNIRLVPGNFDDTLPGVLKDMPAVDFAFIDGNHRLLPTIKYFEQILPHAHNDTILVLDDIHWSREMETAWQAIRSSEAVRCSIDLFFIGIILFRNEFREKQDFVIRF